jgi:hypothetical protein
VGLAMLDACSRQAERLDSVSGPGPFSRASCHHDALNSVYNAMVIALTRQRIWLDELLRHIEKQ